MAIPQTPDSEPNKLGAPRRLEIDVNQYPLSNIMTNIFDRAIFKSEDFLNRSTIAETDKAKYIAELAADLGINLNADTLTRNLFRPWASRTTARLTSAYLARICAFLFETADQFGFTEYLELVQDLRGRYADRKRSTDNRPADDRSTDDPASPVNPPTTGHYLPAWFVGKQRWYLYERIGDDDTYLDARFGIGVGEIVFHRKADRLEVTLISISRNIRREYKGEAFCDDHFQYLYIKASIKGGHIAFLSLTLSEFLQARQSIMLGHFTYHSLHYHHLLTKAVVVQKKEAGRRGITPGDYYYQNTTKYALLDQTISRFLYLRAKNRLGLPRTRVNTLEDLEYIVDGLENLRTDIKLSKFAGEYYVYYKRRDGQLCEDALHISRNHEKRYCESTYTHKTDALEHNCKTYIGRTFANGRIVAVQLNERLSNEGDPEDPILLSFQAPDDSVKFDDCQTMTGMVSGLQDNDRLPVSYNCLLVRQPNKLPGFLGKEDPRVIGYFNRLPHSRIAAAPSRFRLDDLR